MLRWELRDYHLDGRDYLAQSAFFNFSRKFLTFLTFDIFNIFDIFDILNILLESKWLNECVGVE